ncbi:MAG TPA: HAMP domain-containing sensor histidine kinase, partial [Candidatus Limnocylindrales bacterium]|nr:HAMP domain-containing sensor histidine kinase [Candidatus Limnocylindrales bacterium]
FANPSARVLAAQAGINLNAPIGLGIPRELFPRSLLRMARELRRAGSFTYDLTVDGRSFLCHVAPLGPHRAEGFVAVLNDVTELKALDRMKSDMMRMTSHDLKNPLQAAMANLELLHDDVYETATGEVRESLDAVDQQLQRMYRIISGILDTERARTRLATLAMFPAERIIEDVADDMRLFARERAVALETSAAPGTPSIRCDLEQFERALGNLVENGLKYTPAGGRVRLTVRGDGANVLFEVADTGVGIPPPIQPLIFERGFRGQQAGVEQVDGTGIGLSLVKTVIENHRGTVWFESEEGSGTCFFVQLPAAQPVSY